MARFRPRPLHHRGRPRHLGDRRFAPERDCPGCGEPTRCDVCVRCARNRTPVRDNT